MDGNDHGSDGKCPVMHGTPKSPTAGTTGTGGPTSWISGFFTRTPPLLHGEDFNYSKGSRK